LSWRIRERPGFTTVEFHGELDEATELSELRRRLSGPVRFNLGELRRINSSGAHAWVEFIGDLPGVTELTLNQCSPAFVEQLNMIVNFAGDAVVRSVYARYACGRCDSEIEQLLDMRTHLSDGTEEVPRFPCPTCKRTMRCSELPERYFAFMS
jgi:hypothetical protein